MLLKSIKLHNIRSYENQEIIFPQGSVLLTGDIGSGKSSILHAVEFGIFGVKKGELPAYTLLRHGKREGSVELSMIIDGKNVTIKRTLKKNSDGIKQEAGYIISNDVKRDGTAEELRAIALDLLGYPKDLLKKGKDSIYRFTVYTPQEEMKRILYESVDLRIDTLRRIFNIDKYKRIIENTRLAAMWLREKKRHLEGFISDLEHKKTDLLERKNEAAEIEGKITQIMPKMDQINAAIKDKKNAAEKVEEDIKQLNTLRTSLSVLDSSIRHKAEQAKRTQAEIILIDCQILDVKKSLDSCNQAATLDDMQKRALNKEKQCDDADEAYQKLMISAGETELCIKKSNELIRKIDSMDICPACEQKVSQGHKLGISLREDKLCKDAQEKLKNLSDEASKAARLKLELRKEQIAIAREKNEIDIMKFRIAALNEKIYAKEEKSRLIKILNDEINSLASKKSELDSEISKYSKTEQGYKIIREEMNQLLSNERSLELDKRKFETQRDSVKAQMQGIEKEIARKQDARKSLDRIAFLRNWLDEFFVNLMLNIEKHVMANIHSQFNRFFRDWFNVLIEDESINVCVDEQFTPVIEQNGYETYIENLSGGEKTSVALSYRLALNKVINDIIPGIKTKDIIILDEPTDGFSAEQLDNVRDVLKQLDMKQIIIVSHEGKVESFVDNVIRISKQDGMSFGS